MFPAHAPHDRAVAAGLKRSAPPRARRHARAAVPRWVPILFGIDLACCVFIGISAVASAASVDPRAAPAQWTSLSLWMLAALVCAIGDVGLLRRGDWGLRWSLVGLAMVMISLATNGALYWIGRIAGGAEGDDEWVRIAGGAEGDDEWVRLAGGASITGWAVAKILRLAYNVLYFRALAIYSRASATVRRQRAS